MPDRRVPERIWAGPGGTWDRKNIYDDDDEGTEYVRADLFKKLALALQAIDLNSPDESTRETAKLALSEKSSFRDFICNTKEVKDA